MSYNVIRLVALEGQAASDARFAQFLTDSAFLPEKKKILANVEIYNKVTFNCTNLIKKIKAHTYY